MIAEFAFRLHQLLRLRANQCLKELWKVVLNTDNDWVRLCALKQLRLGDLLLVRAERLHHHLKQEKEVDEGC